MLNFTSEPSPGRSPTKLDLIHQIQLNVITMCRRLQLHQDLDVAFVSDRLCKDPCTDLNKKKKIYKENQTVEVETKLPTLYSFAMK